MMFTTHLLAALNPAGAGGLYPYPSRQAGQQESYVPAVIYGSWVR